MGAPDMLLFPHTTYNMAPDTYHLGDISDMVDLESNERLQEARRLLHIAFNQQTKTLGLSPPQLFSRSS